MWIMVKRKLTVGGLISHLASVVYYHDFYYFSTKLLLMKILVLLSHMQSLYGISFQVLCCPISRNPRSLATAG